MVGLARFCESTFTADPVPVLSRVHNFGRLWVRLKWITIPIGVIILGTQRRYIAAIVAFATPWIAGLLTVPGQVGTVEAKFMSMAGSFGLQERGHWRPD